MWQAMVTLEIPVLEKVLRAALVYGVILVLLRVFGKRGLASTNTLDFIVLFLLAGGVEDAIVGDDTSLVGGVVSAITLVVLNTALTYLTNVSPRAARILQGRPTTVVENGHVRERGLKALGLRARELDHAVRSQNGDDISEIEHGELTPSGQLVLTLKPEEQSATKGDMAALTERLQHIERLLTARG
ncbi:conserved membrane protein of unknown function [Modestobacter italicus]|uniref:YetF C-terminal domain-containing protein n=1 Tax=Modestobacter italicus (strain DSM 44449 / CECT 9708 / BC 501) TaxID=2732864 RepID=I4EYK5_MODI5|nr:YetF domain-containing protein [Modestobacter marinus]CCH88468.1 conserved membrane protein of unknown function [Modestobacter marinus]